MTTEEEELFMNIKPVMALISIKRHPTTPHVSTISKKIDTTYAHTCGIIDMLDDYDYVDTTKKGRKRFIKLTDKGFNVSQSFEDVLKNIKINKKKWSV